MLTYKKILLHMASFTSVRMIIGAISVIYMLQSSVSLADIAYIKSLQAVILIASSIIVANFMNKFNRKYFYLLSVLSSFSWLFIYFLGGFYKIILYFYIAEICNAISLVIFNNLSNAYLLDQYVKDTKTKKFEIVLGKYNEYSFIGMAFCAATGAICYNYLMEYLFLISSFLSLLLFIIGIIYLPNQFGTSSTKKALLFKNKDIFLILRKIRRLSLFIVPGVLIAVFYQLIIQYWQVISAEIPFILKHSYMYGVIFIANLYVQSLAGKIIKYTNIWIFNLSFIFMLLGLICLYFAMTLENIYLLMIGFSLLFFIIRTNFLFTHIYSHKNITKHIRLKYDSYINTITGVFTGFFLLVSGYFIEQFGLIILIYISVFLVVIAFLYFLITLGISKLGNK